VTSSNLISGGKLSQGTEEAEDNDEVLNDAIPVFQFVTARLEDLAKLNESSTELPVLLLCLQSLLIKAPSSAAKNKHFKRYVSAKLAPCLIAYLDLADASQRRSAFWQKRSSGTHGAALRLSEAHVRALVPSCISALAILLGPRADMRPVLESVFHRALICSHARNKVIAVNNLRELLQNPENVVKIAHHEYDGGDDESMDFDSMPLFKLIADCLEECAKCEDEPRLVLAATECAAALLHSLDGIASGKAIGKRDAEAILKTFPTLSDADYLGEFNS